MATLREVFNKPLVESLLAADPVKATKFWSSGAFQSDGRISRLIASGSQGFEVPSIMEIDANLESNYSNTIYTDIAEPRMIGAKTMKGLMAYENEAFTEASLAKYLENGIEGLALIAPQIDAMWATKAEHRAVATLVGLRNHDQANGKKITTEVAVPFSYASFLDAEGTMPEALQGRGILVVHPVVAVGMRKAQMLIPFTDPSNLRTVDTYNGRTVVVTKEGTVTKTGSTVKYVSYLANMGAFAAESVADAEDLELARDASRGNGGGFTTLWTRRNVLVHPMGYSFLGTTLTGGTKNEAISASLSDLALAANWQLALDAEKVPFRILVTTAT